MRKLKYAFLFMVFSLTGFVLCLHFMFDPMLARDKVVPTVELINEHEFLAIFHIGVVKIIPIEFNIDTNRLEYDYETTYTSAAAVFTVLDAIATSTGWTLETRGTNAHAYSKFVRFNEDYDAERTVSISFFSETQRIKVVTTRGRFVPPIGVRKEGR